MVSGGDGGEPAQRRIRMSRTIMTEIRISTIVVTRPRQRGRAPSMIGRFSDMAIALRRVWHGQRCLPGAGCLALGQRRAVGRDHAPAAVQRPLDKLEAEQALALECSGQR